MAKILLPGEPAPWFRARALSGNPDYAFDMAGGRWVVLLFLGSAAPEPSQAALGQLQAHRRLFDDAHACFFGITVDRGDAEAGRIAQQLPGIRWFLDYDRRISTLYGAITTTGDHPAYAPHWLLLDPMLRVRARAGLDQGAALLAELERWIGVGAELPAAPVLVVPDILPRELCRHLIGLHQSDGGKESGFMSEVGGVTVEKFDHAHKRRADYIVGDERLLATLKNHMATRLRPLIARAFQADTNRIERFLIACYDGGHGGHFRAHRDNTTKGTAHRKFACTINLNAEDYEGGDLSFPEFGPRRYRAPTGGAVVFSCSLLHEARPVTRGRRYAFLPFLYDDDGARIRERNLPFVGPELQDYRSGLPPEDKPAKLH